MEKSKKCKTKTRKSYYARSENPAGKTDLEIAAEVEGVDDEIALLRSQIKKIWEEDPNDLETILKALDILTKLVKTRGDSDKKKLNLTEAISNVIKDIAVPIGLTSLKK